MPEPIANHHGVHEARNREVAHDRLLAGTMHRMSEFDNEVRREQVRRQQVLSAAEFESQYGYRHLGGPLSEVFRPEGDLLEVAQRVAATGPLATQGWVAEQSPYGPILLRQHDLKMSVLNTKGREEKRRRRAWDTDFTITTAQGFAVDTDRTEACWVIADGRAAYWGRSLNSLELSSVRTAAARFLVDRQ